MMQKEYAVLIVDENGEDVALIQRFLSRNLIPTKQVDSVAKGGEALETLRRGEHDFLIVGETLADMDRSEFLKRLSETLGFETLPILCLVGDETATIAQTLRAKRIETLRKTMLTPEKLREAMVASLERAELRAEKKRAESLFALLSDHSDDAIALTDADGTLLAANKRYLALFRLDESSVGKKLGAKNYDEIFRFSPHQAEESVELVNAEGRAIPAKVKRLFIEERGKRAFMLTVCKPDRCDASAFEPSKELATTDADWLRKLEQDSKNALQTATIILRAKARRLAKKNISTLLQEHHQNLHCIALAAECATVSESGLKVNLDQYARRVIERFERSPLMREDVQFKRECHEAWADFIESALVGFILNELISNALQHAFASRGGTITISIVKEKDQSVSVAVSDNGVGLPARVEKPFQTVGLLVVSSLVKRLNGKLELKRHMGTSVRVNFPQEVPQPA